MAVQARAFAVLARMMGLLAAATAIHATRLVKTIADLKLPDAIEPLGWMADGALARLLATAEQDHALIHRWRAEEQIVLVQLLATRKLA